MAYGVESHGAGHQHEVTINHTPTNTNLAFNITMQKADGTNQTEANRDSMFQAVLDKLVSLSSVTFVSATKRGEFTTPVTPTP